MAVQSPVCLRFEHRVFISAGTASSVGGGSRCAPGQVVHEILALILTAWLLDLAAVVVGDLGKVVAVHIRALVPDRGRIFQRVLPEEAR